MKKHIAVILCVVLTALTMACLKNAEGNNAITQQDLLHHRFVLISSDGKDFSTKEHVPSIRNFSTEC